MPLAQILLLAGLALALRALGALRFASSTGGGASPLRLWGIFAASAACLYWLQPGVSIRYLDFWLPTATLAVTALGWLLTAAPGQRFTPENRRAAAALVGLVLLAALTRYLGPGDLLVRGRPPVFAQVLLAAAALALLLGAAGWAASRGGRGLAALLGGASVLLIALLVVLKSPTLSLLAAQAVRGLTGQNPALAAPYDIRWLGFSYVCFRLIHTLRDRQLGRGGEPVGLRDYISYVIFFPAVVAGPIDRLERFTPDLRGSSPAAEDLGEAGRRLALGLFKKFVVADTLALAALSPQNALQVRGAGWMWLLLYAYAFQIFFDFSGYTDIAVGLGRILGVRLPENFSAPYRKPNLAQFWNSWHMTLTQWIRGYTFNPLVRFLRGRLRLSPAPVMLATQLTTMLLIGLWHGVTWNFVLWGAWHGLGLFIQNRWTDFIRPRAAGLPARAQAGLGLLSTALTFHYVALGWVFFALPTPEVSAAVLRRLFGL